MKRIIVLFFITVFTAEILLRIYNNMFVDPYYPPVYKSDAQIGYVLKPNLNVKIGRGRGSYSIKTNSLGMRDREGIEKEDGYRVLVLGDSLSMGGGLEDDFNYVKILEKKINVYRKSVVMNGAVAGYGTDNCMEFFKKFGPVLKPDLVVLALTFENDIRDNILGLNKFNVINGRLVLSADMLRIASDNLLSKKTSVFYKNLYCVDAILKQKLYIYRFIKKYLLDMRIKFNFKKGRIGIMSPESLLLAPPPEVVKNGIEITKDYIKKIRNMAKYQKSDFALVLIPFKKQVSAKRADDLMSDYRDIDFKTIKLNRPQNKFMSFCDSEGIIALDLLPYMKNNSCDLYLSNDSHWNKDGHSLVAGIICDFIKNKIL